MKESKPWTIGECSYIYWLVIYGLNTKEVTTILAEKLLPSRTWNAVSSQTTEVRKFINEAAGQKLERPTRPNFRDFMRKVAKVPTPEVLLKYKPEVIKSILPIRKVTIINKKDLNPTIEDKLPVEMVEVNSVEDVANQETKKTIFLQST